MLFIFLAAFTFFSCSNDDTTKEIETPKDVNITIDVPEGKLSADDANFSMKIETTGEWSAKSDQPWCVLSKVQGTGNVFINGTVEANDQKEARTATITITADGIVKTITINQIGAGDSSIALTLDPEDGIIPAEGGNFSLGIVANGNWEAASGQSWSTLSDLNGTGSKTITGSIAANTDENNREVLITVTSAGGVKESVKITQLGKEDNSIAISLDPAEGNMPFKSGDFSIKIVTKAKWELTSDQTWVTLSATSGTGNATITGKISTNEDKNDRKVQFTVKTIGSDDAKSESLTLTQSGKPDSDGGDDTDPDSPAGVAGRIEIPKLRGDALNPFYTHDTKVNGKSLITYSFEYDCTQKSARWVAFTFNTSTPHNSVGRSGNFSADPLLDSKYQIGGNDYKGSGYSRGHLVASSDRQYSVEANRQTFYMSNMNPQIQNGFNGGIWLNLERQVQSWGYGIKNNSDTLYVVKGGTIDNDNVSGYLKKTNKTIPIPKHFYMAILSLKDGQYKAIGFWFDHKAYSKTVSYKTCAISIDELEQKTGIDFFPNLKKEIETKVEGDLNLNDWTWN